MIKNSEAELRPSQVSKTKLFLKIIDGFKSLNIFTKSPILHVWQFSGNAFHLISSYLIFIFWFYLSESFNTLEWGGINTMKMNI